MMHIQGYKANRGEVYFLRRERACGLCQFCFCSYGVPKLNLGIDLGMDFGVNLGVSYFLSFDLSANIPRTGLHAHDSGLENPMPSENYGMTR